MNPLETKVHSEREMTADLKMEGDLKRALLDPAPEKSRDLAGVNRLFGQWAKLASAIVGTPWAFLLAVGLVFIWGITGPLFHFSDTWQLVINTATTIITFLMVFLIQNTQNRDAKAMHLKLDELIRAVETARNQMIDIEHLSDDELKTLEERFRDIRETCSAESANQPAA